MVTCSTCQGSGRLLYGQSPFNMTEGACYSCNGTRVYESDKVYKCKTCKDTGITHYGPGFVEGPCNNCNRY